MYILELIYRNPVSLRPLRRPPLLPRLIYHIKPGYSRTHQLLSYKDTEAEPLPDGALNYFGHFLRSVEKLDLGAGR